MLLATIELKLSSDSLIPSIAEAPALVRCFLLAPDDCTALNADCLHFELEAVDVEVLTTVLAAAAGISGRGETWFGDLFGDTSDEGSGGVSSVLLKRSTVLLLRSALSSIG